MERDELSWLAKRITSWAWRSLAPRLPLARLCNGCNVSYLLGPAAFNMLPIWYVVIYGRLLPEPSSTSEDRRVVYANQRQGYPVYVSKRRGTVRRLFFTSHR